MTKPDWVPELETLVGYVFRETVRLERAMTHASSRNGDGTNYERLEFLGDRVLGLVIAEMLFRMYPEADEGHLSVRLNQLVNADTCAEVCDEVGLAPFIKTGSDVRAGAAKTRKGIRADVMESLIAAIYLDGGLEAARPVIHRFWEARARSEASARRDAKTELQEWAHSRELGHPLYVIESREGPDHDPVFTVSVKVGGIRPATGRGTSKRQAEQEAAAAVLTREGVWQHDGESS